MRPNADHDITLITVSGEDKPGVSARLLGVLSEHHATILDIGQAVIHETLSLGFLIQVPTKEAWKTVSKELLYAGYELGLKIKFASVSAADYGNWVSDQGKPRHIITLLGRTLKAEPFARLADILFKYGMNIDVITRLSGRVPLDAPDPPTMASAELSVRGTPSDAAAMRAEFAALAHELGVDIAFQVDNIYRRNRRLVAFDMDSTLIQAEVIDELAAEAGVAAEVTAITEAAMRGEIDFQDSLRQRLALLKGLDESVLAEVADRLPLTEGAEKLIEMLKHFGYKVAIISGGFTYFGHHLQQRLGIDIVHANTLEIIDGKLTGHVVGPIVDGQRKADLLREIVAEEGIEMEQVIAVGDGANDLPMLSLAGLGIAFQAKPIVRENADHALTTVGLDGILYLIGVRNRETLEQLR